MIWQEAVLDALHRFADRHNTPKVTRQQLIDEELDRIVKDTQSVGATPAQTLSRVLQELRDNKSIYFASDGVYILLVDKPIQVEEQDLPDDAIDFVLEQNKLQFGPIPTSDQTGLVRQRRGQERIRSLTLKNYNHQCALCDVIDTQLLIASHISRWADDLNGRGDLSNVMCLCRFHDPLFEYGYISLADDFTLLKKRSIQSRTITRILEAVNEFRLPENNIPGINYLHKHRLRTGFVIVPDSRIEPYTNSANQV